MVNFAFILLTKQIFGGAERRFTQLLQYLATKYPGRYYFVITWDLYNKIQKIFPDYPTEILIPIGSQSLPIKINKSLPIQEEVNSDEKLTIARQIYRYLKNYRLQKKYYRELEKIRKEKKISSFLGVYSGIIPLYFYLMKKKRDVGIIFCDMDSWFTDVLPNDKKYWYRKFSSFNYALEKSDFIDFLSPFILQGIRARNIFIKEDSIAFTPCSFTNYSKCRMGDKGIFQIAFAGRLEKDKNPLLFLEAAILLSKKYPEMIFHIMGEGRLASEVKEKVSQSKLKNILFHGFNPKPIELLANSSILVSIQSSNNYPSQSVLEAMACGNVIIASDVGDTRLFINKSNGILINLELTALINAIELLYLDRNLCKLMQNNAYQYVRKNHTVEKMSEYYIDLFNKAYSKVIS
jgi:glycosyltransferase involved in cell wall biosynthesis